MYLPHAVVIVCFDGLTGGEYRGTVLKCYLVGYCLPHAVVIVCFDGLTGGEYRGTVLKCYLHGGLLF